MFYKVIPTQLVPPKQKGYIVSSAHHYNTHHHFQWYSNTKGLEQQLETSK